MSHACTDVSAQASVETSVETPTDVRQMRKVLHLLSVIMTDVLFFVWYFWFSLF